MRLGLLLLLLLAFGLRLFRLDAQSIWWDEGISLHLATSSLTAIVADRINNIHPPLYFFLLKGWLTLSGVTPFSARYLSVLASWLQVTAVYAVLRRWFGLGTAWVGAILVAISGLSVIYGQEIRVYALLPLVYVALLAITHELTVPSSAAINSRRWWVILGFTTWIGLHLHYIVTFVIFYVALWAGIVFFRRRQWSAMRRWLITYTLVGLASLPWFLALLSNWQAVQAEANAGTFVTKAVPLPFLLGQVWVFHLTGLAGALADPLLRYLAGATAVALLFLLLIRIWTAVTRKSTVALTSHWLLPLGLALFVWSVRSFSHPRYVAIYAVGLFLLSAYLIWPQYRSRSLPTPWLARFLAIALAGGLMITSLWGLGRYFFAETVAKDDVRSVAAYLAETAVAGDLILIPDTDWSLPFEYNGEAQIIMPGVANQPQMWADLRQATAVGQRVFVMDYERGTRDWQQVVPFALEMAGQQIDEQSFAGLILRTYLLHTAVTAPAVAANRASFGPIQLTEAWLEQGASADSAITIALGWQLAQPDTRRLNVALRLLDDDGWPVVTQDFVLVDGDGRPTDHWQVGDTAVTYHILPLPVGLIPGEYTAALTVYAKEAAGLQTLDLLDTQGAPSGQQYIMGTVSLAAPQPIPSVLSELPIEPLPQPLAAAPGLQLLAAEITPQQVQSGQPIVVQLFWQASSVDLPDLSFQFILRQNGTIIAQGDNELIQARFPTSQWQRGQVVGERRLVTVPVNVVGEVELLLQVDAFAYDLGSVNVAAVSHQYELPVTAVPLDVQFDDLARLIGYELAQLETTTSEPVIITLYWEAVAPTDVDFTMFTHLLNQNGQLVGQHDSSPANGTRPTTGWVSGEIIADRHEMIFREPEFVGQAVIEIGIYDPFTGSRLLTSSGDDFIILPMSLAVGK